MKTIVLACPHSRHDSMASEIQAALPEWQIHRISRQEELTRENLAALKPQWVFFPHWSWIIPTDIHENFTCVIFHMTDLPYGRGGSPLQNLIDRGHKQTKISALKCAAGLDTGSIYSKVPLGLEGTAEEILQRAAVLIQQQIISIIKNPPTPMPQEGTPVTFKRRQPKDGDLMPLSDLNKIYDYIRMLDATGYPPAFIATPDFLFEFSSATLKTDCLEAKVSIRRRLKNE